jgi:hypothetical protein
MPDQNRSPDGIPRQDAGRSSPDVERPATGGQPDARGKGASDRQGAAPRADDPAASGGDGPGRIGLTSDRQPDLVAPSGVNERDHGAAGDQAMGGGNVSLDGDDELRPRGNTARTQGTWAAQGGDSGAVGKAPGPGLSDRNGPSDPDASHPSGRPRS